MERIRREFAAAWSAIGQAWGVAPSTAAVQGYLLIHGGPLTHSEIQRALSLSHRATRVALADCEAWGILERAQEPRRSGSRGPAGAAWIAVDDHWEWFRRVAEARKGREADPVMPVLERCLAAAATEAGRSEGAPPDREAAELHGRIQSMMTFIRQFDRALSAVVRADTRALANLFGTLDRLEPAALDRLLAGLATIDPDDLARAASTLAALPPATLDRVIKLGGAPGVGRLLRVLS